MVVEGPGHGVRLGEMPGEHLEAAVRGQFARLDALRKAGFGHVAVFRNQGAMAGASQPHPHSQLVASWDVPPALEQERRQFLDHRERTDRCLLCDLAAEEASGEREVGRRGGFVFLAPWAGAHPMELLLVPETCSPDLLRTEPSSWAAAQAWVDRLLQSALPGTASNLWVHHAPEEAATFHWHAHVVPRQDVTGGWELATGWQLEPLPPEQAAVFYREAWACLTAGSPA